MPPLPASDDRPSVLLIGTVPALREEVRGHVETGYCVVEAASVPEALVLARRIRPDLVVTDASVPDLDGVELLQRLRAAPETAETPVILFSLGAGEADSLGLATALGHFLADWEPPPHVGLGPEGPDPAEEAFVESLDAIVRERMGEVGFATASLAVALGLSPRQLRRRLTQATGESPAQRIRRVRMDTAAALLELGASVKEVGFAVGFSSTSGFRHAFRAAFGVAPSSHRAAVPESVGGTVDQPTGSV